MTIVAVVALAVVVSLASPAAAQRTTGIPPGQEALVASMLGKGEVLPGDCRFDGASITMSEVHARFACGEPPTDVALTLGPPGTSRRGAVETERFVLSVRQGTPPEGLMAAVAERVRRLEDQFRWHETGPRVTPEPSMGLLAPAPATADPPAVGPPPETPFAWLAPLGFGWFGPWLVLAALALALAAAARGPTRPRRGDALALAGLSAFALLNRLALGLWGPFRVNGVGSMWVEGALSPALLDAYGPGYAEVLGPLAALAVARPDTALFVANACLGALVAPLAYLALRRAGLAFRAAALAALVVACDPAAVLFSATESYVPLITALLAAAAALLVAPPPDRARRLAFTAAGALLLAAAVRVHPVAWVPAALIPLAALAGLGPWSVRLRHLAASASAAALAVALTSGAVVDRVAGEALSSPTVRDTATSATDHAYAVTAVLVGLLGARLAPARAAGWIPLAAAAVAACLVLRPLYAQSALWQASFDRLFLLWPLLALVALLPERLVDSRLWGWGAAILTAWLLVKAGPERPPDTTDLREHRWLAERFGDLAPGCRVAWVERVGPRKMLLPVYRVPGAPRELADAVRDPASWRAEDVEHETRRGCLIYVRSSLCSSVEGRPACDAVEARWRLEPYAREVFAPVPSRAGLPYDREEIEVVLSRVRGAASL